MKSTKYQLLLCEYEALKRDLKQHRETIDQLREENEELLQEKKY